MKSENRFKKGLQNAVENTNDNILHNTLDVATDNILYNTTYNIRDNILENVLQKPRKNRGKNHTVYLSADVSDALDRRAKQSGISKSELVDGVLRRVLLEH